MPPRRGLTGSDPVDSQRPWKRFDHEGGRQVSLSALHNPQKFPAPLGTTQISGVKRQPEQFRAVMPNRVLASWPVTEQPRASRDSTTVW